MSTAEESNAGRRTQGERSEATRAALLAAARRLFAERGYADVAMEQVVAEAGVTRGALYHHFAGKRELLAAVYEQLEAELVAQVAAGEVQGASAGEILLGGAEIFLDRCLEPEVQQIVLLDAPAVLGWERWREIGARYGLGLIEAVLRAGMESGEIDEQPVEPLAHALLGALDELAMLVARADDPRPAREAAGRTLSTIVEALTTRR